MIYIDLDASVTKLFKKNSSLADLMHSPISMSDHSAQHCAKFESNTNRITFEYAPNMVIVKVHPLSHNLMLIKQRFSGLIFFKFIIVRY